MHKEREKTWSTNLKDQAEDTKRVIDMGVIGMIEIEIEDGVIRMNKSPIK